MNNLNYFPIQKIKLLDKLPLYSGDISKNYILGVDPSYSESLTADKFSMCLLELEGDAASVVNSYAENGPFRNILTILMI